MQYNRLGNAGIKVSELGFGSWVTVGRSVDLDLTKKLIYQAFDKGINFFDTAESYAGGHAELLVGQALKDLPRDELVISTKLFFGAKKLPNCTGLSRKHIIEGMQASLKRLRLDYVDLIFCHRPDPETPIAETVLAMGHLIRQGYAFYWGTSQWSAAELQEAYRLAKELNCIAPTMEQPKYSMLDRERVEVEYADLYKQYGLGTTVWSPLAQGILTGKYNAGIPDNSRFSVDAWTRPDDLEARLEVARALKVVADELGFDMAAMALAWCLYNPHVSSVILGTNNQAQLQANLAAITVKNQFTDEIYARLNTLLPST